MGIWFEIILLVEVGIIAVFTLINGIPRTRV